VRRKKEKTAIEHVPAPNNEEEYLPKICLSRRFPKVHGVKKRRFLEALASCGGIREASRRTGIAIRSHYYWKETDPAYVEALDFVTTVQNDVFKEEIARRGFHGYNKPIIYKGKITGYYREFSDELAKLEMKARLAEYREGNQINIVNQGPPSITFISAREHPELLCSQPQGTNSVKQIPPESLPILPPAGEKA
jgi:hypothetical protein